MPDQPPPKKNGLLKNKGVLIAAGVGVLVMLFFVMKGNSGSQQSTVTPGPQTNTSGTLSSSDLASVLAALQQSNAYGGSQTMQPDYTSALNGIQASLTTATGQLQQEIHNTQLLNGIATSTAQTAANTNKTVLNTQPKK